MWTGDIFMPSVRYTLHVLSVDEHICTLQHVEYAHEGRSDRERCMLQSDTLNVTIITMLQHISQAFATCPNPFTGMGCSTSV